MLQSTPLDGPLLTRRRSSQTHTAAGRSGWVASPGRHSGCSQPDVACRLLQVSIRNHRPSHHPGSLVNFLSLSFFSLQLRNHCCPLQLRSLVEGPDVLDSGPSKVSVAFLSFPRKGVDPVQTTRPFLHPNRIQISPSFWPWSTLCSHRSRDRPAYISPMQSLKPYLRKRQGLPRVQTSWQAGP